VQILTYDFGRLPPLTTKTTTIDYYYYILSPSIYPLQWIFTLELMVAALAAAVLLKRPAKAVIAAPVEKARRFIDLHDEKRILRLELEKIGEEVSRGAITKHDYRRRSKTIETRLSELNRHLAALKSELKTIDPRYDQIARRLERAESEIDALRASEIQMTNQYRTGRIGKDVYESLTRDLRKRMEKAKETVDSIIVTLREETR
jgi:chromosome segregation ATPase